MTTKSHAHVCLIRLHWFNPLCAKFFTGNIKMYLQYILFFHTDMTQVVEMILTQLNDDNLVPEPEGLNMNFLIVITYVCVKGSITLEIKAHTQRANTCTESSSRHIFKTSKMLHIVILGLMNIFWVNVLDDLKTLSWGCFGYWVCATHTHTYIYILMLLFMWESNTIDTYNVAGRLSLCYATLHWHDSRAVIGRFPRGRFL